MKREEAELAKARLMGWKEGFELGKKLGKKEGRQFTQNEIKEKLRGIGVEEELIVFIFSYETVLEINP